MGKMLDVEFYLAKMLGKIGCRNIPHQEKRKDDHSQGRGPKEPIPFMSLE
jgi:hypothetical protein